MTGLPVSVIFQDHLTQVAEDGRRETNYSDVQHARGRPVCYTELISQVATYVLNGTLTPLVQGFLDIMNRRWWSRIWVVQEAALAESADVICGSTTSSYSEYYLFFSMLLDDYSHEAGLTWSSLGAFKHHMFSVYQVWENPGEDKTALREILPQSRRLEATNRRDHIFGLFGLAVRLDPEVGLPFPDYSIGIPDLFVDVSVRLLRSQGPGYLLPQVGRIQDDVSIPSWVVDWSQRPQQHVPSRGGLYRAAAGSQAMYDLSEDRKQLQVKGVFVDTLSTLRQVGHAAYRYPYESSQAIAGYRNSINTISSLSNDPSKVNAVERIWRALCWNVDKHGECPAKQDVGTHFRTFCDILSSQMEIQDMEQGLLQRAAEFNDIAVHSMPLCLTKKGLVASVPQTARSGDQIALVTGCQTPFVLRSGVHSAYSLVGACYVDGLMEGELFPADDISLEWISIC